VAEGSGHGVGIGGHQGPGMMEQAQVNNTIHFDTGCVTDQGFRLMK